MDWTQWMLIVTKTSIQTEVSCSFRFSSNEEKKWFNEILVWFKNFIELKKENWSDRWEHQHNYL